MLPGNSDLTAGIVYVEGVDVCNTHGRHLLEIHHSVSFLRNCAYPGPLDGHPLFIRQPVIEGIWSDSMKLGRAGVLKIGRG